MSEPSEPIEPDKFDRLWERFCGALEGPIVRSPKPWLYAALFVFVFALPMLIPGGIYVNDKVLDLFVPLDGAHRVLSGQVPHLDFSTPIGTAYYVVLWVAGLIGGTGAHLVAWAAWLPAPLFAAATWWLARRRLPTPLGVLLFVFILILVGSPRSLGTMVVSFLATYNKHGWAAVCLIVLWALVPAEGGTRRDDIIDGVTLTLLTVFCFFTKVTYFGLAGALLLGSFVFLRDRRWVALGAGVSSLAIVGLGMLTPIQQAYLSDLRVTAEAASGEGLFRTSQLTAIVSDNQTLLLGVFLFVLWFIRSAKTVAEQAASSKTILWIGLVTILCCLVAVQSHDTAIPPLAVVGLGCAAAVRRRARQRGAEVPAEGGLRMVSAVSVLILVGSLGTDIVLMGLYPLNRFAVSRPMSTHERVSQIRVPPIGNPSMLPKVAEGEVDPEAYRSVFLSNWPVETGALVDDGLALLEAHGVSDRKVASISFSSAFSWAEDAPPPPHFTAWLDADRTYSAAQSTLSAERLAGAEVAMLSRVDPLVSKVFTEALEADFERAGTSGGWELWIRKGL